MRAPWWANMGTIIALSGKSGSGKDAFADVLVATGYYARIGFADSLKKAARQIFRFSHEQIYGHLKNVVDPRWGFTPRHAMQGLGQGVRERVGESVWMQALINALDPAHNYVVTDVRYLNELEALKATGAKLIRIERPNNPCGLAGDAARHPSETELDDYLGWDRICVNADTIQHLETYAYATAYEFLER
jgi:hypothetical protein